MKIRHEFLLQPTRCRLPDFQFAIDAAKCKELPVVRERAVIRARHFCCLLFFSILFFGDTRLRESLSPRTITLSTQFALMNFFFPVHCCCEIVNTEHAVCVRDFVYTNTRCSQVYVYSCTNYSYIYILCGGAGAGRHASRAHFKAFRKLCTYANKYVL